MKYGLSFEKIFHHPPLHIAMYEMLLRTIVKVNKIQNVISFSPFFEKRKRKLSVHGAAFFDMITEIKIPFELL